MTHADLLPPIRRYAAITPTPLLMLTRHDDVCHDDCYHIYLFLISYFLSGRLR